MSKNVDEFKKILLDDYNKNLKLSWDKRELCTPSTSAQLALYCLCDTFLGEERD